MEEIRRTGKLEVADLEIPLGESEWQQYVQIGAELEESEWKNENWKFPDSEEEMGGFPRLRRK